MQHSRTMNIEKWRYPDFPPRPIKREVILSLMNHDGALYFVNGSDETLDVVSTDSCGFTGQLTLQDTPCYIYKDVKPNEGVRVAKYDNYYDLDFVFGLTIFVESKNLGKVKIISSYNKGGVKAQELLFADMSTKRLVSLQKVE